MGLVLTDNLKPGMLLAADVHDRNGRLLLGSGTELSAKNIHIFRTWGVIEADIAGMEQAGVDNSADGEEDPEELAAAEAALLPLFRHADLAEPAMKEILRLAILRRMRHGTR